MRTVSPSADPPAEAQEFGRFPRMAVHLGLAPEARNHSLTPGFLRGCSPRPFGTRPKSTTPIRSLGRLASVPDFEFFLGQDQTTSGVASRSDGEGQRSLDFRTKGAKARKREKTHLISAGVVIGPACRFNRGLATTCTEHLWRGPSHTDGRRWAWSGPAIRKPSIAHS
jgi:hypothetical protein